MKRLLMNCKDYNGCKNVKFIMAKDDSRLGSENWETIAEVDVKKKSFTHEGETYEVYSDWSVGIKETTSS